MPYGATYVGDTLGGAVVDGVNRTVVWAPGDIAPGERETITLEVQMGDPLPTASLRNTAEVGMVPEEPYVDDNVSVVIHTTAGDKYFPVILKNKDVFPVEAPDL